MILHKMLSDGGIVIGNTETNITAYAYPTSAYAERYKTEPEKVAQEMAKFTWVKGCVTPWEKEYHDRNWERFNADRAGETSD